jgi:hypothetical protein
MPKRKRLAPMAAPEVDLIHPPLNSKMALFGVQMMHANLAAARTVFDAWRTLVRMQQDALLDAFDTQVHEAVPTDEGDDTTVGAKANGKAYTAPHDAHGKDRHGALDAFA